MAVFWGCGGSLVEYYEEQFWGSEQRLEKREQQETEGAISCRILRFFRDFVQGGEAGAREDGRGKELIGLKRGLILAKKGLLLQTKGGLRNKN